MTLAIIACGICALIIGLWLLADYIVPNDEDL